jgi:hypothetical protein
MRVIRADRARPPEEPRKYPGQRLQIEFAVPPFMDAGSTCSRLWRPSWLSRYSSCAI